MPKKPTALNASTLLATKNRMPVDTGTLQRGQTASEKFANLNFKVPEEFGTHFKRTALDHRLKHVQLLTRALEAWEREQGRK